MYKLNIAVLLVFISSFYSCKQETANLEKKYPIIPTPQNISYGNAEIFFNTVTIESDCFINEVLLLKNYFKEQNIAATKKGLLIKLIKEKDTACFEEEAYSLEIDENIIIRATSTKGAFYGIQSLKQIFRKVNNQGVFPKLKIDDKPAFKIRGFMHDTGRNFQSLDLLKEQIEVLAQYKYNVFHWHLTDNPGWRLESKKYPELHSEEATTRKKGSYYTQKDFKELLRFCKARHITLIPELDIPGHTQAFRKAFGIQNMNSKRVGPILLSLFDELCGLASAEDMPYIHIGTDEVRNKEEVIDHAVISEIMKLLQKHKREVIVWKEGIVIEEDTTSINQLWAKFEGRKGHRFIDSRSNYINHLDPFAGMTRLFFQQPCRQEKGDSLALGGVLCTWPDNNVKEGRDILKQNPIYPSMVFYADAIWKGRKKEHKNYWAKLPKEGTKELEDFKDFEEKVIVHRDLFFQKKEFPYLKQTSIKWKIIGPFMHDGDVLKKFPVEEDILDTYKIGNEEFQWEDSIVGGTLHLKHFFGFPALTEVKEGTYYAHTEIFAPTERVQDFWIGFQGWSRSGGRRGGPFPDLGQWHTTNPKIWINDKEIAPPVWKQPNLASTTPEIPFVDEDYFFREPTKIYLKKGWNKVLIKIPHGGNSWKWMFTCVPVTINNKNVKEVNDLIFSPLKQK